VPARVETTDPDGVDFGWVMQTTFVITVTVGAVVVTLLSVGQSLPTWTDKATFAVRVGAVVWIVTAVSVYLYARRQARGEGESEVEESETEAAQSQSET
jgi:hypothetical protein